MSENSSLRALVEQSQFIVNTLMDTNGELTPELELALTKLEVQLPQKVDGYALMIERLEIESEYWKRKASEMQAIAKGCERFRERLKDNLKAAMSDLGKTELVGHDVKFKLSNSKPKIEINEKELDQAYTMQVTTTEVDKKRIEEDLRLGVPVKGAQLVETKSIRAYLNKVGTK